MEARFFGKSANNPSLLAETMLGYIVNCLHGGSKFLLNMIPIAKLNSDFLFKKVDQCKKEIAKPSGKLKVIIRDGNRTNQPFFRKFETVEEKPWLSIEGISLMYDYDHLLKNKKNLWLTEKTGKLEFEDEGLVLTAVWQHLRDLYREECEMILCMSSLDEVAVYPKPIERQRVSTCFKVFCEKIIVALVKYGERRRIDVSGTATFIKKVVTWWTILNVKKKGMDL